MTLFRNIIRATDTFLSTRKCIALRKNNFPFECYFGSKVQVPLPPKRPLTAYMIFCKENRKDLLKDNPSLSTPEQIKVLAKKWSQLSEDMKKPYEVSARKGTQLYGEEHKKFYESLTEEQKEELVRLKAERRESRRLLRSKKALREAGIPKSPNSAYALFVQSEAKKKLPAKNPGEFLKNVAEEWKLLPENSKKAFEKQAEQDKIRYVEEMKKWRTQMLLEGNKKILKAYELLKGRVLEMEEDAAPSPRRKAAKN